MRRAALLAGVALAVLPGLARAQGFPGFTTGQNPTAQQWQSYFAAKIDAANIGVTVAPLVGGQIPLRYLSNAPGAGSVTSVAGLTGTAIAAAPLAGALAGSAAGTLAAGNDARITGAFQAPSGMASGPLAMGTNALTGSNVNLTGGTLSGLSSVSTGTLGVTGPVTLTPPATSLGTGLNVVQTLDGTASGGNGFNASSLSINSDDANAGSSAVSAFMITHYFGGTNMEGGRNTFDVHSIFTAQSNAANPNRNYAATSFGAYAQATDGGTSTANPGALGALFGANPYAVLRSGATNWLEATGGEADVGIAAGASAWYKAGWSIVDLTLDAVHASTYDTGLSISAEAGSIGFNDGILFDGANGAFPIDATGTAIASAAGSYRNGIDFSAATLSNEFLLGPDGFSVSPLGVINGVNYEIGNDATNGNIELGTASAAETPYLDFNGASTAGHNFRLISSAANTLLLQPASGATLTVSGTGAAETGTLSGAGVSSSTTMAATGQASAFDFWTTGSLAGTLPSGTGSALGYNYGSTGDTDFFNLHPTGSVAFDWLQNSTILASMTTAGFSMVGYVKVATVTVATLPACAAGSKGALEYVSDASSPAFNATLTGGSTTYVLAGCNGTNWTAQ